jgi:O-antigen biosynthesis protein
MISIIIPTWNHCDDLLMPCLESIRQYTDLSKVEVIVVANGCNDRTKDYVTSLPARFKLLWFQEQLGFTRATNEGLKVAKGDFIVFMNNDCMLLNQPVNDWLERLKHPFMVDPFVGETGVVEHEYFREKFFVFFCAMISRAVFTQVGYLDESFNYTMCDDVDYAIKVRSIGLKTVMANPFVGDDYNHVGNFPIFHRGEGSMWGTKDWENKSKEGIKLIESRLIKGYYTPFFKPIHLE